VLLGADGAPCCCDVEVPGPCDCDPQGSVFRTRITTCPQGDVFYGPPTRLVRVELSVAMSYSGSQFGPPSGNRPGFLLSQRTSVVGTLSACVTSRGLTYPLGPPEFAYEIQQRSNAPDYFLDYINIERGLPGAAVESDGAISIGGGITRTLPDLSVLATHAVLSMPVNFEGVFRVPNLAVRYPSNEPGQFGGYPSSGLPCNYSGSRQAGGITETLGYSFSDTAAGGALTLTASQSDRESPGFGKDSNWLTSIRWQRQYTLCGDGGPDDSLRLGPGGGCSDCGDASGLVIE
jgi:hypothetical protein